jgi:nucleoside-diphosphate-sugar epimerase
MSKILIIGSSGYIGSRLFQVLVMNGYAVAGLDKTKSQFHNFPTSIMDFKRLAKKDIQDYRHLIVLAAHSSVAESKNDPSGTIENNILGLQNLINILNSEQIVYFASSASVYDGVKNKEAQETEVLTSPRNIYDLSKRMGEDLINMNEINSVIFRFGTVNGPSPNMRYDLVVNAMVRSAMRDKRIYLSNPHVYRAILSIDDLCHAVLNSIRTNFGESRREILNLVSFNTSIGKIAEEVSRHFGVSIEKIETGSTYDFSMTSKKAQELIEFKPRDSIMDIILKVEEKIHESGDA